MLKLTKTFTDYDGNVRTEDFYFNLSKAELMKMEMGETGGLEKLLRKIIAEQDNVKVMEYFDDIISRSYGVKSPDGREFVKSPELTKKFKETEAYSDLFMELVTDAKKAADFVNQVLPNVETASTNTAQPEAVANVTNIPTR